MLSNIIFTNARLYRIKVVPSELCIFCRNSSEMTYHLFWECPVIARVCKGVHNYTDQINPIKKSVNCIVLYIRY